jgi:hypothetical protein
MYKNCIMMPATELIQTVRNLQVINFSEKTVDEKQIEITVFSSQTFNTKIIFNPRKVLAKNKRSNLEE